MRCLCLLFMNEVEKTDGDVEGRRYIVQGEQSISTSFPFMPHPPYLNLFPNASVEESCTCKLLSGSGQTPAAKQGRAYIITLSTSI